MPQTKEILRDFSLFRFYVILAITFSYFLLELVIAHLTHSLILQIDAYHMLYNVLSLITCIVTVKLCQKGASWQNTFGWTRLHVCGVVANICFLSALAFSVTVESIQTIIHADHHDSMHHSAVVGVVGAAGFLVNAICYFTIGGYTFHQNIYLDSHQQHQIGDDFVISASVQAYVKHGMKSRRRQGFIAMFRDIYGSFLVLLVAGVIYYFVESKTESSKEDVLIKYIDPGMTIVAVMILFFLSYNLARDAGHILLLTIPNHINVAALLDELKRKFEEDIYDIHDFHVWHFTSDRIIASAHIVLRKTQNYLAIQYNIVDFLQSNGISHITLQPEFLQVNTPDGSPCLRRRKCFLPCEEDCETMQCCTTSGLPHCESHQEPISAIPGPSTSSDSSTTKGDIPLVKFKATQQEVADAAELEPMILEA